MKLKTKLNNTNMKKIIKLNIFRHASFCKYVDKHAETCISKDEFIENIKKELMYYFWSKSEYEIVISPWVP